MADILPVDKVLGSQNRGAWREGKGRAGIVIRIVHPEDIDVREIVPEDWVSECCVLRGRYCGRSGKNCQ